MLLGRWTAGSAGMAALGAAQGLALWLIYERWPDAGAPAHLVGAIWAVVAGGLVLHFARSGDALSRLFAVASGVGLAFGAVAVWVAYQLPGADAQANGDQSRVWTWSLASTLALFVLAPFLQIYQATGRLRFRYTDLYRWSWRNFFVFALGAALTTVFWLVLLLWGELFGLLGIEVFREFFKDPLFAYPATGAAFAYGLSVARERDHAIDALIGITQSLFRAMLLLVSLVSLAFLASLPLNSLGPLFATSSAAALLIGWLAVHILLFNAVYLDGASPPPYRPWLRWLFATGALTLPVIGGVACYAVALRVAQYGLTPDRCWAALCAAILSGYGAGYALAVLRRGVPWLPWIRSVNVVMSLVVIAAAFALHTPLADPLRASLRNQLARLEDGRTSWEKFDFEVLRFQLGQRGLAALHRLREQAPNDAARQRISLALAAQGLREPSLDEADFTLVPAGRSWPAGLLAVVRASDRGGWSFGSCAGGKCFVVAADLDGIGAAEELVVNPNGSRIVAFSFDDPSRKWRAVGKVEPVFLSPEQSRAVAAGDVQTAPARLRDVVIAGQRFSFTSY
jgi:hypothetical protein